MSWIGGGVKGKKSGLVGYVKRREGIAEHAEPYLWSRARADLVSGIMGGSKKDLLTDCVSESDWLQ